MFRIRLFGGFALEAPSGARLPPLPKRRAEAVLAVLAVGGDLGCTRERLAALVWPENDEASSRHGLRDALHTIRRGLDAGAVPSGDRLLRLDPAVVACDVRDFTEAVASGRPADAVRAYTGPLLEGFHVGDAPEFEHWLDGERTRLAREYLEALKALAAGAEQDGHWDEAAGWWARAVEHDPLNSHLVLRHLGALAAMGDRANAIKLADAHIARLREELDLEPDREVLTQVERIRRGEIPVVPRIPPPPKVVSEPVNSATAFQQTDGQLASPPPPSRRLARVAGVFALLLVGAGAARIWLKPSPLEARSKTTVAVLPFQNLSADSALGYFARGLHNELETQLYRVSSLKVVGGPSVAEYQDTKKSLHQVGDELGAGSLVKASVQVSGNRFRVIVQLFDPDSQTELWAQTYDSTLDNVFAVQSEIARDVVDQVGVALTQAEAEAIAAVPTQNPQAYRFYLQGMDYMRRPGALGQNFTSARQLFERAVALDSTFALAYAEMSRADHALIDLGYDNTPARLQLAEREADVALRLAPRLPQAHVAKGEASYLSRGQYRKALDEFAVALRYAPNDGQVLEAVGWTYRLQGKWDSALVTFAHAQRLDPRNATVFHSLGDVRHMLHQYPEAIAAYRQAIALAPDVIQTRLSLAWSYIMWKGDLDTLRAVLANLPPDADPGLGGRSVAKDRIGLFLLERRPDSVLAYLRRNRPSTDPDTILSRVFPAAMAELIRHDTAAAKVELDSALVILDARARARPGDPEVRGSRCFAWALLGRTKAIREGGCLDLADPWTLWRAGEGDSAAAALERELAGPSATTVPYLRLDPRWDPMRGDPRFQALLVKYADPLKSSPSIRE